MNLRLPGLFIAADFLSLLGNSIMTIALPWLVLIRTGDVAAAGTVAAVTAIPAFLAAIVGGVVIDRLGRRRVTILADLLSATAVAALAVVDATTGLTMAWFIVLGLIGALIDVPGMTAREALMPDVASAAGMRLERLAGVREGLFGVAFLVGPALAGIGLGLLPEHVVVLATAACSALAALLTWMLPREVGGRPQHGTSGLRAMIADLGEGARALWSSRVLFALTVLSTGSVAAFGPLQGILLPAHFARLGAPEQLGFVVTALAVGSILSSASYAALATRVSRRSFFVAALVVASAGLVVLALLPDFWVIFGGMAILGVGSGLLAPLVPVLVAEQVPAEVRGRVLGLQNAALMAVAPVAMLGVGLIAAGAGIGVAMWVIAGLWLVVVVAGLVAPSLRSLEAPAPVGR